MKCIKCGERLDVRKGAYITKPIPVHLECPKKDKNKKILKTKFVKLIKKLSPQPGKEHKVYVGKKYEVLESRPEDNTLVFFKESDIWIKTVAGRVKLKKGEYEYVNKK